MTTNTETRRILKMLLATLALAVTGAAQATVLKEEQGSNGLTQYLDGGELGAGGGNRNRIVRIQEWVCPSGSVRPVNGLVEVQGPPDVFSRHQRLEIRLESKECLVRKVVDWETGEEAYEIVAMQKKGGNGGRYITVGKTEEQGNEGIGSNGSNAAAADSAEASVSGYFNDCNKTAFNLLTDPVPSRRKKPHEYACFKDYVRHAK